MIHHIHVEDLSKVEPSKGDIVIVESESFPNIVEISDKIIQMNAFPLFSLTHDIYSKVKLNSRQLTNSDGLRIVSKFNLGFIQKFIFNPDELTLDLSNVLAIIDGDSKIDQITSFLKDRGVSITRVTYDELEKMVFSSPEFELMRFQTQSIRSNVDKEEALRYITSRCVRALRKIGATDKYYSRLEKELELLERTSLITVIYDVYRTIVGQPAILRGSANNLLVNYLLGIGKIDPVRFNLPYERFINPWKMYSRTTRITPSS